MSQLIQRILRLRREKRIVRTILFRLCELPAVFLMRRGFSKLACRLAKLAYVTRSPEIEVCHYQSMASWVDMHGQMQEIYPERMLTLYPVRSVGFKCEHTSLHTHTHHVSLPSISLNTLPQVEVIGGSELVFTPEGSVLYDELALGDVNRYGAKVNGIILQEYHPHFKPAATKDFLLCMYYCEDSPEQIKRAISLLKDHSNNYYHWLLECLPRAILAHRQTDWADAPFLIDADIPDQFIESLRLISPERKHIAIKNGIRLPVQELYFPSVMSTTHDYYGLSPHAEDFIIAPEAVAMLRESFLPSATNVPSEQMQQFIYVARSGGKHRAITNENEVIGAMEEMGFTIVYPGKMSFAKQITLFANAKIIVGPTGAGMANIVFAKQDCRIAVMAAATRNANYFLFAQLAQYVGQQIAYIGCKPETASDLHSNYHVDVQVLKTLVAEFRSRSSN